MRAALVVAVAFLAGCGSAHAKVVRVKVDSQAVGRTLPMRIVIPDGGDPADRPLVVFLHGRGGGPSSSLDDAFFAGLDKLGDRAPIVAFPSGGDHSYWHDRRGARWGRYVLDEVIPAALEKSGADPDRVALGGISMGGFGAFDLATRTDRHFCAVGGHSPALWRTSGETAPGAFDDASDFHRHDVIARAGRLAGTKLWLDAGRSDPFLPGDRAFAAAAAVKLRLARGGHDGAYWDRNFARYLSFYARACAT